MKKIAIIDYGAGNLFSVRAAIMRSFAAHNEPSSNSELSSDEKSASNHNASSNNPLSDDNIFFAQTPLDLAKASHIILPGVGAFADCITTLQSYKGMIAAMEHEIFTNHKPFLGICVGMQMLFEYGNEHGRHAGLGWLEGEVKALQPFPEIKIPHIGWNELHNVSPHPLMASVQNGDDAYFVHSYHATNVNQAHILATTEYGQQIIAVIGKDNILGTQFHPEKSHKTGAIILDNFINIG